MIEKLELPFPLLSDPERSRAIEPFGVADLEDERNISRPAMVLVTPAGGEAWRFVSRDFADRYPEEEAVARVRDLGLSATTQEPPETVDARAGPRALGLDALPFYLRGARFAALAMGLRHGHHDPSIKDDSKAYVAEMDRYFGAVQELRARKGD